MPATLAAAPSADDGYLGLLDAYSRRMQVLIDGRPAYDPLLGGSNRTTLPIGIDDVERIGVVRGPNAASFGSNAFPGTVIITTRHPLDNPRTHAQLRTGNDGIRDVHAGFGQPAGAWDYQVGFDGALATSLLASHVDGVSYLGDGKKVDDHARLDVRP